MQKMLVFLLTALLIADGCEAHTSPEICDVHDLTLCMNPTPRTQLALPRTEEELDKHCLVYQTGMSCMDTWIKGCLPTDKQKLVQQRIVGAQALIEYLCSNDTALRRDYLKEQSCWSLVSPDWSRCVDELQLSAEKISDRRRNIDNFNKTTEMCCTSDAFLSCVGHAGRSCSSAAGALLRRMAWVLAQDFAACNPADEQPGAPCAASGSPRFSALLSLVYYIYYK